MSKQKRLTIPYTVEGEEVGGVIMGRWFDNRDKELNRPEFEVAQGGLLQIKNWSKNKGAFFTPANWQKPLQLFKLIFRLLPALLKHNARGEEIIGLWHAQNESVTPSVADYAAMETAMKRIGKERFVLGVFYKSYIGFEVVRTNKTTIHKSK